MSKAPIQHVILTDPERLRYQKMVAYYYAVYYLQSQTPTYSLDQLFIDLQQFQAQTRSCYYNLQRAGGELFINNLTAAQSCFEASFNTMPAQSYGAQYPRLPAYSAYGGAYPGYYYQQYNGQLQFSAQTSFGTYPPAAQLSGYPGAQFAAAPSAVQGGQGTQNAAPGISQYAYQSLSLPQQFKTNAIPPASASVGPAYAANYTTSALPAVGPIPNFLKISQISSNFAVRGLFQFDSDALNIYSVSYRISGFLQAVFRQFRLARCDGRGLHIYQINLTVQLKRCEIKKTVHFQKSPNDVAGIVFKPDKNCEFVQIKPAQNYQCIATLVNVNFNPKESEHEDLARTVCACFDQMFDAWE